MSGAKYELGDWVRSKITGVEGVYLRHSDSLGHYIGTGESGEYWCESIEPVGPPPNTVPVRIAVAVNEQGESFPMRYRHGWGVKQYASEALRWIDGPILITYLNGHAFLPAAPAEVNATPEVSDEDR